MTASDPEHSKPRQCSGRWRTGPAYPSRTRSSSPTTWCVASAGSLPSTSNGAGKTTFFNLLTGFDTPDSGDWTFNGRKLAGVAPYKVARLGMVRTFQLTKALSRLTVLDNMRLGATSQRGEKIWASWLPFLWRSQEEEITTRARGLLDRFSMLPKEADFAGSLSGGQRKLLEMARALMVGPELIMLDEPMAGVNPALTQSLLQHIKGIREEGATVLCVGLVHGTIQDQQGGLAAIVPTAFIVETLEKAYASDEAARFKLFR